MKETAFSEAITKRTRMGTEYWTDEKFKKPLLRRPALTCSNTPVYEAYRWRAPPFGFSWQLPFKAAGTQTKTDRPQVLAGWLQILVQALRSGILTFTQNPFFENDTWMFFSCNLNLTVWHFLQLGLCSLCLIQMSSYRFPGWGGREYSWLDDKPFNFKYRQRMSLENTRRSYSPKLDCSHGKHFPHRHVRAS